MLHRNASVGVLARVWQPPRHRCVQTGAKTQSVHLQSSPADNDYHFRTFDKVSYRTQPLAIARQQVTQGGAAYTDVKTPPKRQDALRKMQRGKRATPQRFDEYFDKGPVLVRTECGVWYDTHPDNTLASVAKARPSAGEFNLRPKKKKFPRAPDGKIKRYNGSDAAGSRKESGVGKIQHGLLQKQLRFNVADMAPRSNDEGGEPIWKQHSDYKYHESTIHQPEMHSSTVRVRTNGGGVRVMHPDANRFSATLDGHPFSSTVTTNVRHANAYTPTAPYQVLRNTDGRHHGGARVSTFQDATRAMDHTASSHRKLARSLTRTTSCPSLLAEGRDANHQKSGVTFSTDATSSSTSCDKPTPPIQGGSPSHRPVYQVDFNKRPATVSGTTKPQNSYFGRLFAHSYGQRPATEYGTRKQQDLRLFGHAHDTHGSRPWHQMESDKAIHAPATTSGKSVMLRSKGNPEHGLCYFHE